MIPLIKGKMAFVKFLTNRAEKNLNMFKQVCLDQVAVFRGPTKKRKQNKTIIKIEINRKEKDARKKLNPFLTS
jgi:hypothetical protein